MTALDDFIAESRNSNLSDDTISQTLAAQGWDPNMVRVALAGITVPVAPTATAVTAKLSNPTTGQPSLHPLIAALHHVLLWFFIISSTVAIAAVVAALFGESVDSSTLAAFIAVVAITFTPYAILYIMYLLKLRRQPNLIPGKIWSIITICIFSLSTLGAAITLVVSAITGGTASVIVSSALILTLTATVATVYIFAAFVPSSWKIRKPILLVYLPIITILLGSLFIMSLLRLGPALGDETIRKNLVTTVENIQKNVKSTNRLPTESEAKSLIVGSGISYAAKTSSTYQLCAKFALEIKGDTATNYRQNGTADMPITDSYVDSYAFSRPSGNQCFTIESSDLYNIGSDPFQTVTN